MYYIGMDLHKQDLVMAVEDDRGPVGRPRRIACCDVDAIRAAIARWRPFRAVVEASASYRWLYDLVSPVGEESWKERTARRLGLELALHARGRPRQEAKKQHVPFFPEGRGY